MLLFISQKLHINSEGVLGAILISKTDADHGSLETLSWIGILLLHGHQMVASVSQP